MNTSTTTTMQPNEEKWIGLAAGVAASVLPQVISAVRNRRKDFAPEVMPAGSAGDDADAEQKWVAALARAVIPAAISAAPGLINAVRGRGKDAAVGLPATGGMGAEDAEGEEKWGRLAVGLAASVVPEVISAIRNRRKDFAPEVMPAGPAGVGDDADAEQKWVAALARAVIPAAISAAPGLVSAVRGRGKDAAVELPATGGMGAEGAEGEEKWIGLAAGVAASVLPQVISAIRNRRKDFAPEVMPAAPAGAGDDADAEQKWVAALARAVIPAAISAAPGLINAVRGRGKDAAVFSPATGNTEPEADEKWIGLAAGVAASVLPQVIGAIRRRKDFAPETAATGPEAGYGDTVDAEQKWVAALARAVIPAAISAAPGLVNAVRGKDFAPNPAPAPAGQQSSVEDFTEEDEKILRAVGPAIAATMPAVAQAMRGGTDRRYRAAI
jgi:cytochrome c551/c552